MLGQNDHLLSYDDILNFIDDLENGELESTHSPEDLERINHFLAMLAKEGVLSNEADEELILENDIQELLYGEDNPYEYSFSFSHGRDYIIVPAIINGHGEIVLCKSWIKAKWHQTKKFVKKHKKAIIIGAAVVVAATVVICAVVAASATGAAAAASAAGAAAAAGSDKEEKGRSTSNGKESVPSTAPPETYIDTTPVLADAKEAPNLREVLTEHITSFKDLVVEDDLLQISDHSRGGNDDSSLVEKARSLGAFLAHETFDGISQLVYQIPELNEEIKEIGTQILPEILYRSNDNPLIASVDNYKNSVAEGHQMIDEVFSTDLAEHYALKENTSDLGHDFTVGILPLPEGGFSGKKGWELKNPKFQPAKNSATNINGRLYRGHALDQMQNRGVPPSVVESTIQSGEIVNVNKNIGTVEYFDPVNKIKVVLNEREEVVTVIIVDRVK